MEDEGVVGVAGLSGAGWEITAVRFLIGRTRRARARSGARVLSSAARKDAGLFVLPGKMVPPSDHMAEIILVFLVAKLISLHFSFVKNLK